MLTHELLERAAARAPGRDAIVGETRATFGEIESTSAATASLLRDRGVRRGERVALLLENSLQFVVALFGVLKAGAVAVPVNPGTKPQKLLHILDDCAAAALVVGTGEQVDESTLGLLAGRLTVIRAHEAAVVPADARHPSAPNPRLIDNDLALVLYTSGTTGLPKGVMLTHRTVCNNAWAIGSYLGNTPDDVVLCTLPLSFSYGLFQLLTAVEVGHGIVLEQSLAYPADAVLRMRELGVTGLPGVPTTFAKLLPQLERREVALPALRYVTNAGAAIPEGHLARLREVLPGVRIFCMYGQTECTRASYLDPELLDVKPGSVGRAMPNCELYVVDDEGQRLPPDSTGELVVRGANLMRGYWGSREETAARLRDGELLGEKVLYTGDLFHMDDDGYLTFVGRHDDVFKTGGQKVSPLEVESTIYELPEVAEVAVVGAPDPIEGLSVKAYVVTATGSELTEAGVRRHCRARLEPHLVPRQVAFVDGLPKTDSGKIDRSALRDQCVASPEYS
jgi:amino acid adenylation domain-containing protein